MNLRRIPLAALAAAAVLGLSACQTVPPENADIAAARSALTQAQSHPAAARAASVELERAQQALQRAQSAWAQDRDVDETRHLAYLAKRRAEVVLALATQAQAEERIQQAGTERERARLEARTREAEAAQRAALQAQANARVAQGQAQAAQGQAQMSQQEAEAARQRAAQAAQLAEAERARAAQQAERAASLERDLQSLQAKNTQRGLVVTLGDVLFATGQATLQPGATRTAQQLAAVLQQYPERRVLVEGFTDSQGSEAMNLELSQRRAEAFRRALVEAGVPADRIELRAHGEAYPVADNGTAAGRQQNRRVEVLFSDTQGRFAPR